MSIDTILLHSISALIPQEAVSASYTEAIYILMYYIICYLLLLTAVVAALYDGITQRYNVTMECCVTGKLWMFCELCITAFCCGLWISWEVVDKYE